MKDVASCDKPCGAASGLRSTDLRMGEPGTGNAVSPLSEHIGQEEGTRGNDTSEYPEERKESLESLSSGERKGSSPNRILRGSLRALRRRGSRANMTAPQGGRGVTNRAGSRMAQESPTVEGYSPVGETRATPSLCS
jgi:hypothetical protein